MLFDYFLNHTFQKRMKNFVLYDSSEKNVFESFDLSKINFGYYDRGINRRYLLRGDKNGLRK